MSGKTAALLIIGIPLGVIVGGLIVCVVLDLLDAHRSEKARATTCPEPDQADAVVLPFAGNTHPLRAGIEVYGTAPDDGAA